MTSDTEPEELIVRLHREGKTTREISKVVHKNFTYIGAVLRRKFPDEYINNDNSKTISKETEALKLFRKGKDLVYVAVKLDMKSDEVKKVYSDFLNLKGFYSLEDILSELGNSVHSLVQACKKVMQSGIGVDKVIRVAENLEEMPRIESQYNELRRS